MGRLWVAGRFAECIILKEQQYLPKASILVDSF